MLYIYNIVFRNTKHIIPYYYTISFQGGRGRQRREKRKGKERETERELWDDHSVGSRMSHAAIIVAVALAAEWLKDEPCSNHCSCSFGRRVAQG